MGSEGLGQALGPQLLLRQLLLRQGHFIVGLQRIIPSLEVLILFLQHVKIPEEAILSALQIVNVLAKLLRQAALQALEILGHTLENLAGVWVWVVGSVIHLAYGRSLPLTVYAYPVLTANARFDAEGCCYCAQKQQKDPASVANSMGNNPRGLTPRGRVQPKKRRRGAGGCALEMYRATI